MLSRPLGIRVFDGEIEEDTGEANEIDQKTL